MDVRRTGDLLSAGDGIENFFGRNRFAFAEEPSQDVIHKIQPFVLGGMQDLQVLLDGSPLAVPGKQLIIGHPKPGCRIQMVDVLVVGERARFADQGIDHVAKIDPLLALPEQSRQTLQALVPVPEFKMVLVDEHLHRQADVFAADRVRVPLDTQEAVGLHRDSRRRERVDSLPRKSFQRFRFFPKRHGACLIAARHDLPQKCQILFPVGEVATPPQSQRLIKPRFQMAMRRLHVAVLMRLTDIDAMTLQTVMIQ